MNRREQIDNILSNLYKATGGLYKPSAQFYRYDPNRIADALWCMLDNMPFGETYTKSVYEAVDALVELGKDVGKALDVPQEGA
jgi:hypothetical protein